jgi:hypothetical protein
MNKDVVVLGPSECVTLDWAATLHIAAMHLEKIALKGYGPEIDAERNKVLDLLQTDLQFYLPRRSICKCAGGQRDE